MKPDYRPKLMLDYSSPAEESEREKASEERRRKALGDYNESTFGERRPLRNAVVLSLVRVAIAVPLGFILPRWAVRLLPPFLPLLALVVALIWRRLRRD